MGEVGAWQGWGRCAAAAAVGLGRCAGGVGSRQRANVAIVLLATDKSQSIFVCVRLSKVVVETFNEVEIKCLNLKEFNECTDHGV